MEAENIAALATSATAVLTVIGNQIAQGRKAREAREQKDLDRELRQQEHERKIDSSIQKAHESAVGAMLAASTQTQEVFKSILDRVNALFDQEQAGHAECRREVNELRNELNLERQARRTLEHKLAPFLRSITPRDFPAAPSDTPPEPEKKFKPPIPR
jgi:hypothetical protein